MRRQPAGFDVDRYREAAALVGPFLAGLYPRPFSPTSEEMPDAAHAVYVAADRHGQVVYVGSVCRGNGHALRARLSEHIRHRPEAAGWHVVWVMRLRDDVGVREVRWAEARVGRCLCPTGNCRLPRFPTAHRPVTARS